MSRRMTILFLVKTLELRVPIILIMITVQVQVLKFKKLKFVSLNVCGLCAKLKFPDFDFFLKQYGIICLTEIKTDHYDEVNIDGFRFISASTAVA